MTRPRVRNTNDGTSEQPYLRTDLNLGTLAELPTWSKAPAKGDNLLRALRDAGYQGTQYGDPKLSRELGMGCTAGGRVNRPGEIAPLVRDWKRSGVDCATLHVGWGHESDSEIDALVSEIIDVSDSEDLPLYIETHRATITQDTWRTIQIIERNPDIRLNADFSHWYTGLEMPYGDFGEKLKFLAPAFERVRFIHGRCGNSSHMQVALDHPSMEKSLLHFKEMWTRSCIGFLKSAAPGDYISFNPELLHPSINYAQTFRQPDGRYDEQSDRWEDGLKMTRIAVECFREARKRLVSSGS